ncbi:glyceraldehyde-3-phosphate dehydrogenase, partial [Guyparkeria sp. 1SP6A2]|nr:glyceraldehyde-3-phosphate dehydrogenase [Guyparkeria sp. 1SP6A2]
QAGVEILLFGKTLINATTIDIIKAHKIASRYIGESLSLEQTIPLLTSLAEMTLSPCKIDIGQLAHRYWQHHDDADAMQDYLHTALV